MHYFFAKSGPLNGFDKILGQSKLVKLCVALPPAGIQLHSTMWYRVEDATIDDYEDLIRRLSQRKPPECQSNRWFTADISSFYYFLLWKLSMTGHVVPQNATLTWWPDMNDDDDIESRESKEEAARTRAKLAVDFFRSYKCGRE